MRDPILTRHNVVKTMAYVFLYGGFILQIVVGDSQDSTQNIILQISLFVVYVLVNHIILRKVISKYISLIFELVLLLQGPILIILFILGTILWG